MFSMQGIAKSFGGVRALDGVNLTVRPGECLGLCGENGAGKSTLMKVLSGVYPHGTWEGEIVFDGKPLRAHGVRDSEAAGIVIIHQELMMVPAMSVAENILLGNEPRRFGGLVDVQAMHRRAGGLLAELGLVDVNVELPVAHFGGGHQQLFEIARALAKQARLIIFDEPTSSLSGHEVEVLLGIIEGLKSRGVACIYISHKLDEVARVCDTVSVLRDGRHVGTAPMASMNTDDIIEKMVGRKMQSLFPRTPHAIGEVVFEAQGVTAFDPVDASRKRVDGVSFQVRRGEILGIAGLVGAGRTELLASIFGTWKGIHRGQVRLDGKMLRIRSPRDAIRAGLCLLPEDRKRHGIVPLMAVADNITLATLGAFAHAGRIDADAELTAAQASIDRLRIKTASPALPIVSLSGGNQQKAVLARLLMAKPRVLFLDEPTRGVDVGARVDIYELINELAAQGVAIVMVSSELNEVLGVSDRVLVMGEGRLRGDFPIDGLTSERVLAAALGPAMSDH